MSNASGNPPANDTAVLESDGAISVATLAELGWTLKPEGLCRGETCVVVADRSALVTDSGVSLAVLGELLDRPVVVDPDAGLAAIGVPRARRRAAIRGLQAPDFSLPNIAGGHTALSDHRGTKRLLIAFATW